MENQVKYKVLSGIPIPRAPKGDGHPRGAVKGPHRDGKYPWGHMKVGDALCVGPYEPKRMTNVLTIANHSWVASYMDFKFCARTMDGQIFIFRIR